MLCSRITVQCTITSYLRSLHPRSNPQTLLVSRGYSEKPTEPFKSPENQTGNASPKVVEESPSQKKTQAELDQELKLKLQGLLGDGGAAGVEYEDGKPVSMKRSVKANMFRYI